MKSSLKWLCFLLMTSCVFGVSINNYLDETGFPQLIPSVQKLDKQSGKYPMPKVIKVSADERLAYEASIFSKRLTGRFGAWKAEKALPGEKAECRLVLTQKGTPENPQGYVVTVSKDGFEVASRSPQGIFYGVHTLCNLITNNVTVAIPCCKITDWPDLPMRGFYLDLRWLKNENVDKFCQILETCAHFKLNAIEADFGANLPFKNSPFLEQKNVFTEESLQKIVDCCQRNYIDIVPHLQVLTHDQWLRAHPKYMTDITARKTYNNGQHNATWNTIVCPNKSLGRELTDYAIKETIRIFKPRYFHMSMDEFRLCEWYKCDTCPNGHTVEEILREVKHYVELIQSLGVIPEIYQDAYTPERCNFDTLAIPMRNALPRNIIVSFWDYAVKPRDDQFKALVKDGFKDIVGVSFCYRLANTMTLPVMVKEEGGKGIILTYWGWIRNQMVDPSGYNCNAAASTVLTAEFGWKAQKGVKLTKLTWDPALELARFLPFPIAHRSPGQSLSRVPLQSFFNRRLGGDGNYPLLDQKNIQDLQADLKKNYYGFQITPTQNGGIGAMVFSGGKDVTYYSKPVSVPIHAQMRGISLLLTAGLPDNAGDFDYYHSGSRPTLLKMKVHYTDGSSRIRDLKYKYHFNDWNSDSSGLESSFVVRGVDRKSRQVSFYVTNWNNPYPKKEIESIEFIPENKHGVSLAILDMVALGASRKMEVTNGLPQAVQEQEPEEDGEMGFPTNLIDFSSGKIPRGVRCSFEGHFAEGERPSFQVVSDKTAPSGKALKFVVPPQTEYSTQNRPRVIVDIPVTEPEQTASMAVTYRVSQPSAVGHSGIYLGNDSSYSQHIVEFGFGAKASKNWTTHYLSRNCMVAQSEKMDKIGIIRFSLWLEGYTEPVEVYLESIYGTDQTYKWMNCILDVDAE